MSLYAVTPVDPGFYGVFNLSRGVEGFVLYNPSFVKEIFFSGTGEEFSELKERVLLSNRVYECGDTFIVSWRNNGVGLVG